jgi:hypothetical protein
MDETKQCPDCAERVLAQARKCRYCGYRFDGQRSERSSLLDAVAGIRRDRGSNATIDEFLAKWGLELDDGEAVEFFVLAEVDGRLGYLVITAARLAFFAQEGRSQHVKLFEERLSHVSGARVRGRLGGRVELSGPGFQHVMRAMARAQAASVVDWLGSHAGGLTEDSLGERGSD